MSATGRTEAAYQFWLLLFLPSADVETVTPAQGILGIVLEPVLVPDLAGGSLATFASIAITGSERRRIAGQIDVGLFFGRSAGGEQSGCQERQKFPHGWKNL